MCEQARLLSVDLAEDLNLVRAFVSRRPQAIRGLDVATALDEATRLVVERSRQLRQVTESLLRVSERQAEINAARPVEPRGPTDRDTTKRIY